jgi:hypothetical protein
VSGRARAFGRRSRAFGHRSSGCRGGETRARDLRLRWRARDSEIISNEVLARALTAEGSPTTLARARREYQGLLLADIHARAQARLGRPLREGWLDRYERMGSRLRTSFLHAAAAMGAEPSRCAVVEDTASGVAAAVSAGMRVFGYVTDSDEAALRRASAEPLHSLEELAQRLGIGPAGTASRN